MEIEKSPPELIAKKLWKIVRIMFYMMRKSIGKSKMMVELHMLVKRGKIASKAAIGNLILHHNYYYSTLTCRNSNNDINMSSFISPRHYEFSCSNTPNNNIIYPSKRNKNTYNHQAVLMHKVFDILNRYDESSPLSGFGHSSNSPMVRVTDSPFPVIKDGEMDNYHQVDKDAEEFIKKFYKDLKNQKRIAALESPPPYHVWAM